MAISVEDINKVRQKCRIDSLAKIGPAQILRALFKHFNDALRNPDLQFVPFVCSNSADAVIADAACKLYFLVAIKPAASTTNAWLKGSNHATTAAAAGDVAIPLIGTGGGGKAQTLAFPDGLPLGTGFTVNCHTTVNGNTKSQDADCATGFAIIGAP